MKREGAKKLEPVFYEVDLGVPTMIRRDGERRQAREIRRQTASIAWLECAHTIHVVQYLVMLKLSFNLDWICV